MRILHSRPSGRGRRGFTLVELLIVVAIIALLVMIILPGINRARELARRTVCAGNIRAIAVGLVSYAKDNDDAVPLACWQSGTSATSRVIRRMNYFISYVRESQIPAGHPIPDGHLGLLIQPGNEYIDHGRDFYCPSAKDVMWQYTNPTHEEVVAIRAQGGDILNLWWDHEDRPSGNAGWVRLGYGTRPMIGWAGNTGRPPWDSSTFSNNNNGKLPRLTTPTPLNYNGQRMMFSLRSNDAMVADVTNNPGRVDRFHVDGVNVGWVDGSVHWFDRGGFSQLWEDWDGSYSDTVEDDIHYEAERDSASGEVTIEGVWNDMSG